MFTKKWLCVHRYFEQWISQRKKWWKWTQIKSLVTRMHCWGGLSRVTALTCIVSSLQYHVVSLHRFFWTARLCDSASIWINNTSGRSFFLIVKQWLADLLRESGGEKMRKVSPRCGAFAWCQTVNRDCTSLVRRLWFLSSSLGFSLSEPPPLSTETCWIDLDDFGVLILSCRQKSFFLAGMSRLPTELAPSYQEARPRTITERNASPVSGYTFSV